jgi:hypothetical protein
MLVMKKLLIGSIVGGLILFVWQFLSWGLLNLHSNMQMYTPKQDSVLQYLDSQFSEDGFYFMPGYKPGTSHEDMEKQMKAADGKPWAQVYFHKAMHEDMTTNMIKSLIGNIILVALLCWILMKFNSPGFLTILVGSLFTGIIGFINFPHTYHIWFQTSDMMAHATDTVVSFGALGIWLGWWLRRK